MIFLWTLWWEYFIYNEVNFIFVVLDMFSKWHILFHVLTLVMHHMWRLAKMIFQKIVRLHGSLDIPLLSEIQSSMLIFSRFCGKRLGHNYDSAAPRILRPMVKKKKKKTSFFLHWHSQNLHTIVQYVLWWGKSPFALVYMRISSQAVDYKNSVETEQLSEHVEVIER